MFVLLGARLMLINIFLVERKGESLINGRANTVKWGYFRPWVYFRPLARNEL